MNLEGLNVLTTSMVAFITSAIAVVLAEMGDKTQLLAMCFATKYKAWKVLAGVLIATVINHALAVTAGYFLKEVLARYSNLIQLIASISFIGFALWTIRGDTIDDKSKGKLKLGVIITVAIAFFIAEMGDKTQLATVALAAKFGNPVFVLIGTTIGMLIADGIGIIFGVIMNKKINEKFLKWVSAGLFVLFGVFGYIEVVNKLADFGTVVLTTALLLILTAIFAMIIIKNSDKKNLNNKNEISCRTNKKTDI
ncbi:MAG: TMEM165/GDT1 family protein [Clostridia bacterium]